MWRGGICREIGGSFEHEIIQNHRASIVRAVPNECMFHIRQRWADVEYLLEVYQFVAFTEEGEWFPAVYRVCGVWSRTDG